MSFIGKNIKKLRQEKNMSQQEFGDLFKISRGSVGSYEEGRAEPKLDTIVSIASYFSISIDDLIIKNLSQKSLQNAAVQKTIEKNNTSNERSKYLEERVADLEQKMEKIATIINLD